MTTRQMIIRLIRMFLRIAPLLKTPMQSTQGMRGGSRGKERIGDPGDVNSTRGLRR